MTSYPRHSNHKTSESLGEFVEVVTNLSNANQSRKGGTRDTGWKSKHQHDLNSIRSVDAINNALTYLLEE